MPIKIKYSNRYDTYLFVLIASLVAGNMFGALQVPRVLALILFFPCLNGYSKVNNVIGQMKFWLLLFLAYSFASCAWNPAGATDGLIGAIYNVVHVLFFFEIIVFSRFAGNPIKAIIYGFLVAFAISAIIAFWELTTDQHLDTSKTKEAKASNTGYEIYLRYFAAVTFYNFNMYVTFLSFLLPFLFYGISSNQNKRIVRVVFVVATVIAVILMLYNGSRGGLLAFIIMAAIYFAFSIRGVRNISVYIFLLVGLLSLVLYNYGSSILNTLMMRGAMTSVGYEEDSRFVIWSNVMKVIHEYSGLGCGADGLSAAMEKYVHGGITVAHNVFLEVLSEYGVIFFALFLYFFFALFKRARNIVDKPRKICLYQALFSLPIVGIINSGYLTQPVLWAAMASLYVFANYERIVFYNKSLRK